jgi:hypothetical protein
LPLRRDNHVQPRNNLPGLLDDELDLEFVHAMHRHGVRSGISGESNFAAFLYKRPQQLSHSQTILARAQRAVPQPDYPTV